MNTQQIIVIGSTFTPIIPLGFGFFNYTRLTRDLKWITWLIFIALIIQIWANVLWIQSQNNLFLTHIYVPIEFAFLARVYAFWFEDRIPYKWIQGLIILFGFLSLLNSLLIQPFSGFNSYAFSVSYVSFVGFAIYYFYLLLAAEKLEPLETNPRFWINTSVLIYYASTLLILSLSNLINTKSQEFVDIAWVFHAFLNLLHYSFYAIALWIRPKISKSISSS